MRWHGWARHGMATMGVEWNGPVWHCMACSGVAWRGLARTGMHWKERGGMEWMEGGDAASDRPKGGIGNLLTSFKLRKTGIDTTK